MAYQVIQVERGKPAFSQRNKLGDVVYELEFRWSMRDGWYFGMRDATGAPLFQLRRLTVNTDLLAACRHDERCPVGTLIAIDLQGTNAAPGYEDLVSGPSLADPQGRVAIIYGTDE